MAGELTELLEVKLGFFREELLKARGVRQRKDYRIIPEHLTHISVNLCKDNVISMTPAGTRS